LIERKHGKAHHVIATSHIANISIENNAILRYVTAKSLTKSSHLTPLGLRHIRVLESPPSESRNSIVKRELRNLSDSRLSMGYGVNSVLPPFQAARILIDYDDSIGLIYIDL
jgi:hypothetical protein